MTPGAFTSASDRRWERRYQTIQQRRESPPSRRQQRRENPWLTYDQPVTSETLDDIRETRNGYRPGASFMDDYFRFSDAVYEWAEARYSEDPDARERSTPSWYDDLVTLVKGSWSCTPTDPKDDVESWDAADISCLFD